MKQLFIVVLLFFVLSVKAQNNHSTTAVADTTKKIEIVEVSCGQCQFHLHGKGCDLAVRIKEKAYFIDGTNIDEHGDAHAKDGFCNAVRKAEVQGNIIHGRFVVTYFKLID